jgi:regulator of protease activity HflC (stomatin/prohibitin superfamily)
MIECCCFICIQESDAGIVEQCGRYYKTYPAGCVFLFPFVFNLAGVMTLKIKNIEIACETKTKDNVFVKVVVAVQYKVKEESVSQAFYKLTDIRSQITSYVFDVVRSSIPQMDLDETFSSKEVVATAVKEQLTELMKEFGFEIITALVTDLDPNSYVKAAMNDINAQSRLRAANSEKADAEKILLIKSAEAEAESRYLSGMGVARQRKALVDGLRETVSEFSSEVEGVQSKDVMDLLLVTQYFDMVKETGIKTQNSSIFLPHGPNAVGTLRKDLQSMFGRK